MFFCCWMDCCVESFRRYVGGFPVFYDFWGKLDRKRPKSANFQNLKVLIFHPMLMQVLQCPSWWTINKYYFSSKRDQLLKYLHIRKLHRMFIFHSIRMWFLLLNGLCQVLSVVCCQVSSTVYGTTSCFVYWSHTLMCSIWTLDPM